MDSCSPEETEGLAGEGVMGKGKTGGLPPPAISMISHPHQCPRKVGYYSDNSKRLRLQPCIAQGPSFTNLRTKQEGKR